MLVSKYIAGLVEPPLHNRHWQTGMVSDKTHRPAVLITQHFYSYETVSFQNVYAPVCAWENVSRTLRDTRSASSWTRQPTLHITHSGFISCPSQFSVCVNLSRTSARHCAYPFPRPGFAWSFPLSPFDIIPRVITFERLHKGHLHR